MIVPENYMSQQTANGLAIHHGSYTAYDDFVSYVSALTSRGSIGIMDEKQPDVDGIQSRAQADRNANSLDAVSTISSSDLDDTYQVYKKQDARDIDPQEARRVLWKIDLHIMPILMMTYMLQYLDKSSINFAAVFGLEKGTNLHGQDYSWLSSIFYFGKYQRTVLDVFLAHFLFRISDRSISCRLLPAAL